MAKGKAQKMQVHQLPIAPWIYLDDPTEDGEYAHQLASMMPKGEHVHLTSALTQTSALFPLITQREYRDKVIVVTSSGTPNTPCTDAHRNAQLLQQAAIKHGCNFASVQVVDADVDAQNTGSTKSGRNWGTNHLHLSIASATETLTITKTTNQVYKWLFSVFSVLETLHLIPDEQMRRTEGISSFHDYEYCPLSESRARPRDQKIQFVAVVLSKPEVGPNNRISWKVADKTGTANFYFTHRGPLSQYTWDWVQALKPGDLKCLPRKPGVLVKERAFVTIAKAPFRITGAVMRGSGLAVQKVGRGMWKAGHKVSLGKRSEWLYAEDVGTDAKGRKYKKPIKKDSGFICYEPSVKKTTIEVFTKKGQKAWGDDDSVASTTAGSVVDEKTAA